MVQFPSQFLSKITNQTPICKYLIMYLSVHHLSPLVPDRFVLILLWPHALPFLQPRYPGGMSELQRYQMEDICIRCPDSCMLENIKTSAPFCWTVSTRATYLFLSFGSLALGMGSKDLNFGIVDVVITWKVHPKWAVYQWQKEMNLRKLRHRRLPHDFWHYRILYVPTSQMGIPLVQNPW